jgi:hypothetical protein
MCLFSDPNTLPAADHRHNWYLFWNKTLGRPSSPGEPMKNGSVLRCYENGFVIYNPMGNGPVTTLLPRRARSLTTGRVALTHAIADCDGDIFITEP